MNFAEGIKRIYVTIACLILVASAIALFDDRPRGDRYDEATAKELSAYFYDTAKDEPGTGVDVSKFLTSDLKHIVNGDIGNISKQGFRMIIVGRCSHPFTEHSKKRKDICDGYNQAKAKLPKELAYHAAQSVGILALVAIGSIFFWMLMAWIGRGFIAKKTSAGSE